MIRSMTHRGASGRGLLCAAALAAVLGISACSGAPQPDAGPSVSYSREVVAPGAAWTTTDGRLTATAAVTGTSGLASARLIVSGAQPAAVWVNGSSVDLSGAAVVGGTSGQPRSVGLPVALFQDGTNTIAVQPSDAAALESPKSFAASVQLDYSSPAPDTGAPWRITTATHEYSNLSGLAEAGGGAGWWFHEDFSAAHPGQVYLLRPDGGVVSWITVPTAKDFADRPVGFVDPEAMAVSNGYMYIADIGNAAALRKPGAKDSKGRPYLTITRFPTPDAASLPPGETAIPAESVQQVRFTYDSDYPYRDAEAMVIDPSNLEMLVIEKRPDDKSPAKVFRVPPMWGNTTPAVAPEVGTLPPGFSKISDAAVDPDGKTIWLRDADTAHQFPLQPGWDAAKALSVKPTSSVALPTQPQGESMTVDDSGAFLVVGSEMKNQPMWAVPRNGAG